MREKKRKPRGLSREQKFFEEEEPICRLVGGHTAERVVRTAELFNFLTGHTAVRKSPLYDCYRPYFVHRNRKGGVQAQQAKPSAQKLGLNSEQTIQISAGRTQCAGRIYDSRLHV
eukprot:Gb_13141 [translate_table: standard]